MMVAFRCFHTLVYVKRSTCGSTISVGKYTSTLILSSASDPGP